MPTFNRNIVTAADITNLQAEKKPKTLTASPPANLGGVTVPSEDDYLTKLVKYVPPEVLAAYLFIAGVVDSNVTTSPHRRAWLGCLLAGAIVITIAWDIRVLKIVRVTQVVMSVVGLAVYVFALGGWFATYSWYHQWYASIALPVFGLLVALLGLKALPTET